MARNLINVDEIPVALNPSPPPPRTPRKKLTQTPATKPRRNAKDERTRDQGHEAKDSTKTKGRTLIPPLPSLEPQQHPT